MIITEERPTAWDCPCVTSRQRIHKRPAYPARTVLYNTDDLAVTYFAPIEETLTSTLVGLSEYYTTNHAAPRKFDKDASQPLPSAESRMWQTAKHQLERCEPNQLQHPGVYWRYTRPNVVII